MDLMCKPTSLSLVALTVLLLAGVWVGPLEAQRRPPAPQPPKEAGLPDDFIQVLPRGRIASVDTPQFVPAAEAKIPGEAWIMGVVMDGQARAYSLNLLNRHEIVNDEIGGVKFAAVW